MSKGNVNFNKNDDYYTPREFVSQFGSFDYDPATTKDKAVDLGIANYDTIETDGLSSDWTKYERIWINPPFTLKHLFFKKASETYQRAHNEIYILFPIEFLTTKRFRENKYHGTLFIPAGRIKFENGEHIAKSPAFGSVVYKFGEFDQIKYI